MGSPDFAVPCLRVVARDHEVPLVVAQPDRPSGRGRHLQAPAVKAAAESMGLAVAQPQRLRGEEGDAFVKRIEEVAPDMIVVVAYGKILPRALLAVPRLGCWNVHASLLPQYRGAAPIQWAVINGESATGICIMQMEEGLDTGPVVARYETTIGATDTAGDLFHRLADAGAQLLSDTLPHIADGTARAVAQDDADASLAPMLRKEDGRLDFSRSDEQVSARARGVDPWPGAFAQLEGEVVKLFRPRVVEAQQIASGGGTALPGTILPSDRHGLVVACGQGAVSFAEMQLPGRKRLPVASVLSGRAIPAGARLA